MWIIVLFPEENMVEAVPVSWLLDKDRCYWPPSGTKINKKIAGCEKPKTDTWGLCKIRILGNKEYDDVIVAREKAKQAQLTSDIEGVDLDRTKRSKRKTQKNRFIYSSSENEESCSSSLSVSPPTPPRDLIRSAKTIDKNNEKQKQINKEVPRKHTLETQGILNESQGALKKKNYQSILQPVHVNPGESSISQGIDVSNKEQPRNQNVYREEERNASPQLKRGPSFSNIYQNQCGGCKRLFRTVNSINLKLDDLINDFQRLCRQLDSKQNVENVINQPLIYETFPISSIDNLMEFENYLQENEDNFKEFVHYLSNIGGDQSYECVKRSLGRVLADAVAVKYNWLGLKEKRAFGILNLTRALIIAVQRNKQITEKQVEKDIKSWLKHAKERLVALEKHNQ